MISRLLAALTVGLNTLVSAAGAAAPAANGGTAIPITMWTHATEQTAEYELEHAALERFNRKQSRYRGELLPAISRNYEDRVQSAAATGTLPCLLEVDGPFLHTFARPGYLRPIDRFVPQAMRDDFLPSIIRQGTFDGRLYSLAQFDSGLALWGNRRYLRAAGVRIPTLDQPWSLTEFEQVLARLSAVNGVEYAITFNVFNRSNEFYSYAYAPILQSFGGDLIDRKDFGSARGILDGAASVAAMRHFQSWFQHGWSRAVFDHIDDFESRRTALSWIGHWKHTPYRKALGDDLVLLPLPDFGHGIKTGSGSWTWAVSSTCPRPEGAWQVLEHLLSADEILAMTTGNGAVPARRSALARSPLYGPRGELALYARQIEAGAAVPRPATPSYRTIRDAFARAVTAIIKGGDVAAELDRAATTIDEEIARQRGPIRR